jgi:hypothetical protein
METSRVNSINILQAALLYKSVIRINSVLAVSLCLYFLAIKKLEKAACKKDVEIE